MVIPFLLCVDLMRSLPRQSMPRTDMPAANVLMEDQFTTSCCTVGVRSLANLLFTF